MLTYSIVIFYLLFGWPKTNFGSLSKGQLQSPNVNHCTFIIFWLKGHWEPQKNKFLKTRNWLQTDPQPHRLTDTKINWWIQKSKNLKKLTLSVVNAGAPDTEYLYYPLDVERVTIKGSLLLAHIKQIIIITTITRISAIIAFIYQFQFLFFPNIVTLTKNLKCINSGRISLCLS